MIMKKTLLMLLLGTTSAMAAGHSIDIPQTAQSTETKPLDITLQFGIMHTQNQDYYIPADKASMIPSVLYGVSLGTQWEVCAHNNSSHHVGVNVGYYTGEEDYDFSSTVIMTQRVHSSVDVIPLLLTYNYEYQLNDRISLFAGVRGGAVIRKTSFDNSVWDYGEYGKFIVDDSSTKVLPTVGVGVGAKVAFSENASLELGYDFGWTFGKDCGDIHATTGKTYDDDYYAQDNRYYGTVKVGFTFSF